MKADMRSIVIVGIGGFGREVVDVIDAINDGQGGPTFDLVGMLDDSPRAEDLARIKERGIDFMGAVDDFVKTAPAVEYVIGIANPRAREAIDAKFTKAGSSAAVLVHPDTTLGSMIDLGPGSIICAGVRMTTNIRLGRHVHVNINTTVGHDSHLGDYTTFNPVVSVSGDCTIEPGASMGVGSAVLQGLTVGRGSFVGAGALVTRSVAENVVVKGVPAR